MTSRDLSDILGGLIPDDREMAKGIRKGAVCRQLAPERIFIRPVIRQLLGYMLSEPSWVVDQIVDCQVRTDGLVIVSVVQPLANGLAIGRDWVLGPVNRFLDDIEDLICRAELHPADAEYLRSLPGIQRNSLKGGK